MKSKFTKVQILIRGMAIMLLAMFCITPMAYATSSLDDSYLDSTLWEQILYGKTGSTAKEIEEYLSNHTTLYIMNETQLRALAEYINNGNSCSGKQIILYNDIEVNPDVEWTPIGTNENRFNGVFDGNGHTISGVTYLKYGKTAEKLNNIGLFGVIGENGVVKNVTTKDFNIDILYIDEDITEGTDIETTYNSTGNIAGCNYGTIKYCTNYSDVFGADNVGGIVGRIEGKGKISNCINYGKVEGYDRVGGIVGGNIGKLNYAAVTNSTNEGEITGKNGTAGIAGFLSDNCEISNCINRGKVNGDFSAGGVVGTAVGTNASTKVTITNCANYAVINGDSWIGGIAGGISRTEIAITNCINNGKINGNTNLGGIVGNQGSSYGSINNCTNKGAINGTSAIGGVIGCYVGSETIPTSTMLTNCINEGNVTGDIYKTAICVGGIVGQSTGSNIEIDNCINKGTITGTGLIGGISGAGGDITNCINEGNIECNDEKSGGIIGEAKNNEIKGCINKGTINGATSTGGIVGLSSGTSAVTIIDCINEGTVDNVENTGGIIGKAGASKTSVVNCVNKKAITASSKGVGGIVGLATGNEIYINKCTNEGSIEHYGGYGIAGILGLSEATSSLTIENSENKSSISGIDYVGGIVGNIETENSSIKNSINNGSVFALGSYAGGILGHIEDDVDEEEYVQKSLSIENCINKKDVSASSYAGGIVGYMYINESMIKDCTNNGNILVDGEYAGGIAGVANFIPCYNPAIIANCYNSGNITASDYAYAIAEELINWNGNSMVVITKCETSGKVNGVASGTVTTPTVGFSSKDLTIGAKNLTAGADVSTAGADASKIGASKVLRPEINLDRHDTNVVFDITKNGKKVSNEVYLKAGDVIEITATFDRYLAKIYGPLTPITEAPTLYFNNSEMTAGLINANSSNYTTTIKYTYTIKEGANFNKSTLTLNITGNIYFVGPDNLNNPYSVGVTAKIDIEEIKVDTTIPTVNADVYVENALETNRYTAGKELIIEVETTEPITGDYGRPELQISFSESGIGKYNYTEENGKVGYAKCIGATINLTGTSTWMYSYQIQEGDEGKVQLKYTSGTIADIAGNINNLKTLEKEEKDIYADTTLPEVTITAREVQNSLTNKDKITYEFIWNEKIDEFTAEDITVNNGTKGALSEGREWNNGTYLYTMDITPDIALGNVGDLQVIVEQDACKDLASQGNVRTESIITIDKKASILQNLEAYATHNFEVNKDIDTVKEYYNSDEVITIVATFDENIIVKEMPELALAFSESGNVKGTITGEIDANKIIYTYKITKGDMGLLSVRGFTGIVLDAAGNETKITKRVLDGDTIIADTINPELKELNVVTDEGTYKAGKTITIEAIYDEEVYTSWAFGEIRREMITAIDNTSAPILLVKFGNGVERAAQFIRYGENEGSIDRTKLVYTCKIVDGDNGILSITSYKNTEANYVRDIAGNIAALNGKQTGNEIIADTIRPEVTNIVARVDYPSISGTGIYYKEGNRVKIILTFSEEVSSNVLFPDILIGFSEDEGKEPEKYNTYAYESDWNVNSKTIEYSYTIKAGDNGYLWIKVPEGQFRDVAANTNIAEPATKMTNIYADTTAPTVTLIKDTEVEQNNQTITIKATFSEDVYNLDGTRRETLTIADAPKLIYSFGDGANEEISATSIDGAVITYTIHKDPVEDNGTLLYELAKGNLCDKAGNLYYVETTDTTAPLLQSVEISTNAGIYAPNCKEGTKIKVTATFNEPLKAENMKLKAKIGEIELANLLEGEIVEENPSQVEFEYTVNKGDTGEFVILDICAVTNDEIEVEDKTYGWVQDLYGNQKNIYNLKEENIKVSGRAIADTTNPYITNVKVISGKNEITIYTKEEAKEAVLETGRTNANIIEYIVTYSEKVPYNHFEKISITNGVIEAIEYTNTQYTQYKITVRTTVEGVQSLVIQDATVEDVAGNTDSFIRLDAITVDYTKPTVRFISEYNGGIYVLPTNINKVEIRPNVEISEDITKIEYKWDDGEYVEINNYSSSSDISIPTMAFIEAGEHVLSIRVVDLAGNPSETSKRYEVINSYIGILTSTTQYTNQDITATVSFGEGLTDNRKVTFKAEGSQESIELNAAGTDEKGNTQYTIEKNGIIYAEATDKIGNKVFTEYTITNIDKENPVIELELNGADLIIGTNKENATIKTNVTVEDNNWVTEAKYAYIKEDIDVYNITEEQKAKINSNLEREAKIENAVSTKGSTPYYLYVVAKDAAGNETIVKSEAFTVIDTNEKTDVNEETQEETKIPAEIEIGKLISFKQTGKYIDISYNNFSETEEYLDIIKEKEISLTNHIDGNVDFNGYYVEVNGATTITVVGTDACGNQVIATYEVTRDSIEGPEFEVLGNPENWTNEDVKLEVSCYEKLSAVTVNGTDILSKEDGVRSNIVVTQNGDYEFIVTDTYGNVSKKVITVSKIDKDVPVISKVENEGKDITITATDELSGVIEYAITSTTEVPVEWSESNVIKTTKDGIFYAWAKDKTGNISRTENVIVIDTTAPTMTFSYTSLTVTVGVPLEASIVTNEYAIISYSWDGETWVDSTEKLVNLKVSEKSTTTGKYTLYAKASDEAGNESEVQTLEFNVVNVEEIRQPEIVFEDIPTVQVNGVKYVKVSTQMTTEILTDKMNKEALCGKTPEYTKLTEDNKLRTGTEISINGSTKYIVVVNGDVNGDGKVTFLGDVVMANNCRIGQVNLTTIQRLAADINNNGVIEFIADIVAMNNYRLGIIKSL